MPTYDYVCGACGHALEIFQSMTEAPKRKCPACGKSKLERRIGAGAGFLFKGAGFYLTDYRSKSYAEGAKQESAASGEPKPSEAQSSAAQAPGSKSSESKADAKPPAKGEARAKPRRAGGQPPRE
ncbi:MAG: zinc ribbon domain-containing protein [Planctomycetes bacterium]|nr:zinc ribbon domain-containing protein [Planctomycetota bacterium]